MWLLGWVGRVYPWLYLAWWVVFSEWHPTSIAAGIALAVITYDLCERFNASAIPKKAKLRTRTRIVYHKFKS